MSAVKLPGMYKNPKMFLTNIIDKDFQTILRPLNLVQNIYCTPKYRIRDNFITPNGIQANIISFCGLVVCFTICICNGVMNSHRNKLFCFNMVLYISGLSNVVLSAVGFIINFWVSFKLSNHNVDLVLRLQTAHRSMACTKRDALFLAFYHWIKIILLYGSNSIVLTYFYFLFHPDTYDVMISVMVLCFDMNMVYAISMMKLIRNCLEHWYKQMHKRRQGNACISSEEFFHLYMNIMLAYESFKTAFQCLILFHSLNTFLRAMVYVETAIELNDDNSEIKIDSVMTIVGMLFLLLKNVFLHMVLGIESEKFYIQVHKIETTCIMSLSTLDDSDMRNFYKNIIRVNKTFKKLDTCRLLTVDAGSTLRLFRTIGTYTIVLLQFAYL